MFNVLSFFWGSCVGFFSCFVVLSSFAIILVSIIPFLKCVYQVAANRQVFSEIFFFRSVGTFEHKVPLGLSI